MTVTVFEGETRLEAWLLASEYLLTDADGLNVILDIKTPEKETIASRRSNNMINKFYEKENKPSKPVYPIHTVAETIFPGWEYYHNGISGVFDRYPEQYKLFIEGDRSWGRYAYRLLQRKDLKGNVINPLEQVIKKLQTENEKGRAHFRACYEIGIIDGPMDLPLYDSTKDGNRYRGQPCLMHLSFKLIDSKIHLIALYRLHDYRYKVPGNLLGLARLQSFIAKETGFEVGSLVVHSTLAYIESGPKKDFSNLLYEVRSELGNQVSRL